METDTISWRKHPLDETIKKGAGETQSNHIAGETRT